MSIQRHQPNPIEQRKQLVRTYSRSAVLYVGGGVVGGIVLGIVLGTFWFILGLVIAVAGGAYYGSKVRTTLDPNKSIGPGQ